MYKDVLQRLNSDRRVDSKFIERLEKNDFEICYGKYCYWESQPYIMIGKKVVWLVETYDVGNSTGIRYRYRNDVAKEIKYTLNEQKEILDKENELIDSILDK